MKFITDVPTSTIIDKHNVNTYVQMLQDQIEANKNCNRMFQVALDFETLGFDRYHSLDDEPVSMGLCWKSGVRVFVPREYIHIFLGLLDQDCVQVIYHNFQFDGQIARNCGFSFRTQECIEDTMLMYAIISPEEPKGLKPLCFKFLGIPMANYKDVVGTAYPEVIKPGHPTFLKFVDYGTFDAWATWELYHIFRPMMDVPLWEGHEDTLYSYYRRFEIKQQLALMDMSERGIGIDLDALQKTRDQNVTLLEQAEADMCRAAGEIPENVNSAIWLKKMLYEKFNYPIVQTTETGLPSTDDKTLKQLALLKPSPFIEALLRYRKSQKIITSYCDSYLKLTSLRKSKDGYRIHTKYNATGARTGRISSSQPNLQTLNAEVKTYFIPSPKHIFLGADYSALEVRIMAHFSSDENVIDAFLTGKDVHCMNAAKVEGISYEEFYQRYKAGDPWAKERRTLMKPIVYGLSYGAGPSRLAGEMSKALGRDVTFDEAKQIVDTYFNSFPKVKNLLDYFKKIAKKQKFAKTICGRQRPLPNISSRDRRLRGGDERKALNTPIQGSAADIVKAALIKVWEDTLYGELQVLGAHLLLQVHDELVLEVEECNVEAAAARLQELMENPFDKPLRVPLIAEPSYSHNLEDLK